MREWKKMIALLVVAVLMTGITIGVVEETGFSLAEFAKPAECEPIFSDVVSITQMNSADDATVVSITTGASYDYTAYLRGTTAYSTRTFNVTMSDGDVKTAVCIQPSAESPSSISGNTLTKYKINDNFKANYPSQYRTAQCLWNTETGGIGSYLSDRGIESESTLFNNGSGSAIVNSQWGDHADAIINLVKHISAGMAYANDPAHANGTVWVGDYLSYITSIDIPSSSESGTFGDEEVTAFIKAGGAVSSTVEGEDTPVVLDLSYDSSISDANYFYSSVFSLVGTGTVPAGMDLVQTDSAGNLTSTVVAAGNTFYNASETYYRIRVLKSSISSSTTFQVRSGATFGSSSYYFYLLHFATPGIQDLGWTDYAVESQTTEGFARVTFDANVNWTIEKRNANDPDHLLAGAEYRVYSDVNCTNELPTYRFTATGADGRTIQSIPIAILPVYIKEYRAPEGFALDPRVFEVNTSASITYAEDEEQFGGIRFAKQGELLTGVTGTEGSYTFVYSNNPLPGATFRISSVGEKRNQQGELIFADGAIVVSSVTSGNDGTVTITQSDGGQSLPLGTYRITELDSVNGFVNTGLSWDVEIRWDDNGDDISYLLYYGGSEVANSSSYFWISNTRQTVSVSVNKKDVLTNNPLSGADFTIYAAEDIKNVSGTTIIPSGSAIQTVSTAADGSASFTSDLPYGYSFTVRETAAPAGYHVTPGQDYSFSFNSTDHTQGSFSFSHDFSDAYNTVGFELEKHDEAMDSLYSTGDGSLNEAVYGLYAAEDISYPDGVTGIVHPNGTLIAEIVTGYDYTFNYSVSGGTVSLLGTGRVPTASSDNGHASVSGLFPGRYMVKELTASEGYLVDATEYTQTLSNPSGSYVYNVSDTEKRQAFQIIKLEEFRDSGELLPLSDIQFKIYLKSSLGTTSTGAYDFTSCDAVQIVYDGSGDPLLVTDRTIASYLVNNKGFTSGGDYVLVTGATGYAVSEELPYGEYVVREINVPADHMPIDPFTVTISDDSRTPQTLRYIRNTVLTGRIRVTKKDSDTNAPVLIEGTAFQIYKLNATGTDYADVDGSGNPIPITSSYLNPLTGHFESITTYYTTEEGFFVNYVELNAGYYRVLEIPNPEAGKIGIPYGYYYDPAYYVDVHVSSTGVYEESAAGDIIIPASFYNAPVKGQVNILKTGEVLTGFNDVTGKFVYEDRGLVGATYGLYAAEDIYTADMQTDTDGSRTKYYSVGELVDTKITAADGTASFTDIPLGKYVIKEITAPSGYVLDDTAYPVEINYEDYNTQLITKSLNIYDQRQKVKLNVIKENDKGTLKLSNIAFQLFAKSDVRAYDGSLAVAAGTLLATVVSDSNGLVDFGLDLPFAEYEVVERKPAGVIFSESFARHSVYPVDATKVFIADDSDPTPKSFSLNYDPAEITISVYAESVNQSHAEEDYSFVLQNQTTKLQISKLEVSGSAEVKGAKLTLYDDMGDICDTWISGGEPHYVERIAAGTYTLVEELAPDGYLIAEPVTFVVEATGVVQKVSMTDEYTRLKVSKQDLTSKEELPGAKLSIYDASNNLVESWVSSDEPHFVYRLKPGRYMLVEETAPDGYYKAESIVFELSATSEIQQVVMFNDFTRLRVSKQDLTTKEELPGAKLQLFSQKDELLDEWISGNTPHFVEGLAPGKYRLHETLPPDGYYLQEQDVYFELTKGSELQEVVMYNDYTRLKISKQDVTSKKELPGAKLALYDNKETLVEAWVSGEEPHYIEGLAPGVYTLKEEIAPDGYYEAESIVFTLYPSGDVQNIVMENDQTKLKISKLDATTRNELPGAKLTLYDEKGTMVESWVSTSEPHYVEGLRPGNYSLVEESAPDGYSIAEKVEFTLKASGEVQTVEMIDAHDFEDGIITLSRTPHGWDNVRTGDSGAPGYSVKVQVLNKIQNPALVLVGILLVLIALGLAIAGFVFFPEWIRTHVPYLVGAGISTLMFAGALVLIGITTKSVQASSEPVNLSDSAVEERVLTDESISTPLDVLTSNLPDPIMKEEEQEEKAQSVEQTEDASSTYMDVDFHYIALSSDTPYNAPKKVKKDGKLWRYTGDITYGIEEEVLGVVDAESLQITDADSVPETKDYTLSNGNTVSLILLSSDRDSQKRIEIEVKKTVTKVSETDDLHFDDTIEIIYHNDVTGKDETITGRLQGEPEITEEWYDDGVITAVYVADHPDVEKFLITNNEKTVESSEKAERPEFADFAQTIMDALKMPEGSYKIGDSKWTDEIVQRESDGKYVRHGQVLYSYKLFTGKAVYVGTGFGYGSTTKNVYYYLPDSFDNIPAADLTTLYKMTASARYELIED